MCPWWFFNIPWDLTNLGDTLKATESEKKPSSSRPGVVNMVSKQLWDWIFIQKQPGNKCLRAWTGKLIPTVICRVAAPVSLIKEIEEECLIFFNLYFLEQIRPHYSVLVYTSRLCLLEAPEYFWLGWKTHLCSSYETLATSRVFRLFDFNSSYWSHSPLEVDFCRNFHH